MRLTATRRRPAAATAPSWGDLVRRVASLEAELAALRAARPAPRVDEDDAALLALAGRHVDGRAFPAGELLTLATAGDNEARLLADLGIDSRRAAGAWCRRVRDRDLGGLRLVRGDRGAAGYTWWVIAAV